MMKKRHIIIDFVLIISCLFVTYSPSHSATFPREVIQMVVPTPPGGVADAFARTIVTVLKVNKLVPVPMVVENKGGGSGAVGFGYMAQKKGNPYYLLSAPSFVLTTPLQNPGVPTFDQFTPIARLVFEDNVIVVNSKSPYKTMKDLVDSAIKNPKSIRFAGTSVGATDHITMCLIQKMTGCQFNFISFTTQAEVMTALLGEHVDVCCLRPRLAEQYVTTKEIRILGASSEKRLAGIDAPTLREQGINVAHAVFRSIMAPKDIPAEAKTYYINIFTKMNGTKEWKKFLEDNSITDAFLPGDEFYKWLVAENEKLRTILTDLGLIKK